MTDLNEKRAAFEAWALTQGWKQKQIDDKVSGNDSSGYSEPFLDDAWAHFCGGFDAARRAPAAAPAPVAASDDLPLLPEPAGTYEFIVEGDQWAHIAPAYSGKQMRDYARAALAAAPAPAAAPIVQPVADVRAKPSFFVIVDAQGRAEYVTMLGHEAQEHINDACGEGVEGAGKWKAVPVFLWRPTDDHLWNETIRDRDTYHDWADKLAYAIGKRFDVGVGEHSNQNLPWAEALNVIEDEDPTPASSTAVAKDAAEVHGHREPYYLMANCRRLLTHPKWKSSPNWVIAKELFGCGSTSGWAICREAGIDGDSTTVERAAITSSAGEVKP